MTTLPGAVTAAAPGSVIAAPEPGERIAADYYRGPAASKSKGGGGGAAKPKPAGGGRKVASKAGEKRYGLPIGTPLGQTKSVAKKDTATQVSYDTFMQANTPADLRRAASWMSNDDLGRAAEALFSFDSTNERDVAGRIALVRELADRGIDPRRFGYRGGPVQLNPNPKKDPVAKAAEDAAKAAERAAAKVEREKKAAQVIFDRETKEAATTAERERVRAKLREIEKQVGDNLAYGTVDKNLIKIR